MPEQEQVPAVIDSFRDKYFFLSNFYEDVDGYILERDFQATKATNDEDRNRILSAKTAKDAKHIGDTIECRKDWKDIRLAVMHRLVKAKFSKFPFAGLLKKTQDAELIEGNWWHDTYWGVCDGVGENHLGKILMLVRAELIEEDKEADEAFDK